MNGPQLVTYSSAPALDKANIAVSNIAVQSQLGEADLVAGHRPEEAVELVNFADRKLLQAAEEGHPLQPNTKTVFLEAAVALAA